MTKQEKIDLLNEKGFSKIEIDNIINDSDFDWYEFSKDIKELVKTFISAKFKHDATGQWIFVLLVGLLTASVSILGWLKILDTVGTSTLLASIIGYSVGKLQQKIGSKSSE